MKDNSQKEPKLIQQQKETRWFGPPLVALGAGLWGVETIFRVNLQGNFSSDQLVFFEHVIGVILLLPMILWGIKDYSKISKRAWGWLLVSSVLGSAFGTVFFTASLKQLNVSVANVLLNLQPIWSVWVARFLLKEKTAKGFVFWGSLAVLCGIIISMESFSFANFQIQNPLGLLFVAGTIFCWGTATVAGRALMLETPLHIAAPLRFILGAIGTFFIVLLNGNGGSLAQKAELLKQGPILVEYLKLLLIAGMTPLFFYFYGLRYTSAVAGAFCEMAQTIFALAITWGVMGHALAFHQVVAAGCLIAIVTKINLIQLKSE